MADEKPESQPLQKRLENLEKQLRKHDEMFDSHEKNMNELEKNMGKWHDDFLKETGSIDDFMKDLVKRFEG